MQVQVQAGGEYSYPVAGSLGDVLSDLLGRQTQRTDLGGKSGRGTDLTTGGAEVAIVPSNVSIVCSVPTISCRSRVEGLRIAAFSIGLLFVRDGASSGLGLRVHDLHLGGVSLGSCSTMHHQY